MSAEAASTKPNATRGRLLIELHAAQTREQERAEAAAKDGQRIALEQAEAAIKLLTDQLTERTQERDRLKQNLEQLAPQCREQAEAAVAKTTDELTRGLKDAKTEMEELKKKLAITEPLAQKWTEHETVKKEFEQEQHAREIRAKAKTIEAEVGCGRRTPEQWEILAERDKLDGRKPAPEPDYDQLAREDREANAQEQARLAREERARQDRVWRGFEIS